MIMQFQQEWTSYLEEMYSVKQSSMVGGSVPLEHCQRCQDVLPLSTNGEVNGENQQHSTHVCGVAVNKDSKGSTNDRYGRHSAGERRNVNNHEVLTSGMLVLGYTTEGIST